MRLHYPDKRTVADILANTPPAVLETTKTEGHPAQNRLIQGDNLRVMKALLTEHEMAEKVDLVYIDPPFATDTTYRHSKGQTQTISASNGDDIAYTDKRKGAEFIEFLRERLVFLRELMAPHASLYLHIDYKIGHYVKVMMDEIFGQDNFRNDITRIKCNPKNFSRKGYGNVKDMILFYTKTDEFTWHEPRQEFADADIARLFSKIDGKGRRYTTTPLHAPGETENGNTGKEWKGMNPPRGRHWRYDPSVLDDLDKQGLIEWSSTGNPRKIIYASEAEEHGKRLQDIWEYKDPQYPSYPTEKNLDLLQMIISTSSNPGQLVLDCFCGSGTTLVAAQNLGRRWIGIDESAIAIATVNDRVAQKDKGLFDAGNGYSVMVETQGTARLAARRD